VQYKARVVAKGFAHGVDFNDTFSLVAKFAINTCIFAIGIAIDLEIHQMDVKTIFLNGELEEFFYMEQPKSYVR